MEYLSSLNEPQHEAVVTTEGPCMLIAGAGSGKTRVLTYRIAHLIREHNVEPFQILALTFTNKAAREMRERIEEVVGNEARNVWMGTFHSIFARILRFESDKIGYPQNFTIYDTDDSKTLIRQIVKEMELDDKQYKVNMVLSRISSAKNRLMSWQQYQADPITQSDDEQAMRPKLGLIYQRYVERCFLAGAMDFDDLLFNTNVLLRDHPDVLNKYQHRFRYVLVDEFQDTNISQYLITRKLSAVHRNICVVGDDAQSIYAFRGADIQNILNFEKDFPETKVIKLEQNYRSTQNIVNAANSVIYKNKGQLQKNVWTQNAPGAKIPLVRANSDAEEGKLVANSIFEAKASDGLKNAEIAVLYRTNSQSRSIEEALRKNNIKYKIVGGLSFYQRKEIKDLLAYLRMIVNPDDEQAFRRCINLPKRGIGPGSVDKILVNAFDNGKRLWDSLQEAGTFLKGKAGSSVENFVTLIKRCQMENTRKDAFEVANFTAKNSGLLKELYEDKTIEGLSRYENVQELLNAVKEFTDNPENEDKSLNAFLQDVALVTDMDNKDKKEDKDTVTLMTIHMSKGLEFRYVYLVGMEEDLFPSQMMLSSREDLEEERRLFYVAITRAKERLHLSYASTRYRFGNIRNCEPSRFLNDIDSEYIDISKSGSKRQPAVRMGSYTGQFVRSMREDGKRQRAQEVHVKKKPPVRSASSGAADFKADDTTHLQEGMKVEHQKFGIGSVRKIDESGGNRKAVVDFDGTGEKTLLLSFAKLKIHG
ncbi:MAG: exodeoxyribonuclease V subunit gamma [Cyclobacteriaceae bacterium]|nr:exodeoxyribonuclease V subunit gamma [Cyclobacteriaceae bacterium]MCH8516975.1 exodeoxyribonuclease V subunit gamma [Cyclobacteriaceae bacterium]